MQQNVGEMKTGGVGVPKVIIGHEGEVLDRPIMRRVGIEKEVVPERFEREQRTFDEWVVVREVIVVPYRLSLQSGQMHEKADSREEEISRPLLFAKCG